jgi:hypothetical protein
MTRRGATWQSEAWLMHAYAFCGTGLETKQRADPQPAKGQTLPQFDDQLAVPVEVGLVPNQGFEPIAGDVV